MKATIQPQAALEHAKAALGATFLDHERFEWAFKQIKGAIKYPTDTKLLCVIGPTGVGKSRLFNSTKEFVKEYAAGMPTPIDIPFVGFEVPVVNQYNFSWPTFYGTYLKELQPPLPADRSVVYEIARPSSRRENNDTLLMQALAHRRPLVTLLDEAQHLTQVSNSRHLLNHMEHIKSLANRSNILHICFGTYDLARMIRLSGQLARRTHVIHFSRYDAEKPEEAEIFGQAVKDVQKVMKIAHFTDLWSNRAYLYRHSLGCIGTFKTWVLNALQEALAMGRDTITMEDFKARELSEAKLYTMLNEISDGERSLRDELEDGEHRQLQLKLGEINDEEELPKFPPSSDLTTQGRKRRVAERNPKRDPIGPLLPSEDNELQSA
jgi:hypothetical protein